MSVQVVMNFDDEVAKFKRKLIEDALEWSDGNTTVAAAMLGMTRNSLRYHRRALGMPMREYKRRAEKTDPRNDKLRAWR